MATANSKEIYLHDCHIGTWASIREDYLRREKPKIYEAMKRKGILESHLTSFQESYELMSETLTKKLRKERGVTRVLAARNFFDWAAQNIEIMEDVRKSMIDLIRK